MNSKQFLLIAGVVLVIIGVLGFLGVIGPTSEVSVLGPNWFFDNAENWAHTVLGAVLFILGFVLPSGAQKPVVVVVGLVALAVGVYGFFKTELFTATFQLADNILHLVVGLWGLLAGLRGNGTSTAPMA